MASGAPRPSPLRIDDGAGNDPSNMPSTSVATTSTMAQLSSTPGTPTFPSASIPLMTPPAGKTSFQGTDFERPWARSALLSPSRCSSQFFEDGPSPYDLAGLDAPPRPLFARTFSDTSSMSSRFSLLPDPNTWGSATNTNEVEADDDLHTPDPKRDQTVDKGGTIWTFRGISNLGCLLIMCAAIFGLFAGYPLAYHFTNKHPANVATTHKTNSTGQVPDRLLRRFRFDEPPGR